MADSFLTITFIRRDSFTQQKECQYKRSYISGYCVFVVRKLRQFGAIHHNGGEKSAALHRAR